MQKEDTKDLSNSTMNNYYQEQQKSKKKLLLYKDIKYPNYKNDLSYYYNEVDVANIEKAIFKPMNDSAAKNISNYIKFVNNNINKGNDNYYNQNSSQNMNSYFGRNDFPQKMINFERKKEKNKNLFIFKNDSNLGLNLIQNNNNNINNINESINNNIISSKNNNNNNKNNNNKNNNIINNNKNNFNTNKSSIISNRNGKNLHPNKNYGQFYHIDKDFDENRMTIFDTRSLKNMNTNKFNIISQRYFELPKTNKCYYKKKFMRRGNKMPRPERCYFDKMVINKKNYMEPKKPIIIRNNWYFCTKVNKTTKKKKLVVDKCIKFDFVKLKKRRGYNSYRRGNGLKNKLDKKADDIRKKISNDNNNNQPKSREKNKSNSKKNEIIIHEYGKKNKENINNNNRTSKKGEDLKKKNNYYLSTKKTDIFNNSLQKNRQFNGSSFEKKSDKLKWEEKKFSNSSNYYNNNMNNNNSPSKYTNYNGFSNNSKRYISKYNDQNKSPKINIKNIIKKFGDKEFNFYQTNNDKNNRLTMPKIRTHKTTPKSVIIVGTQSSGYLIKKIIGVNIHKRSNSSNFNKVKKQNNNLSFSNENLLMKSNSKNKNNDIENNKDKEIEEKLKRDYHTFNYDKHYGHEENCPKCQSMKMKINYLMEKCKKTNTPNILSHHILEKSSFGKTFELFKIENFITPMKYYEKLYLRNYNNYIYNSKKVFRQLYKSNSELQLRIDKVVKRPDFFMQNYKSNFLAVKEYFNIKK